MKIATIILCFCCLTNYAQWIPTNGPYGASTYCLMYKNNLLFAGTNCGVFVTSNDGEVWERRNNGFPYCSTIESLVEFNGNILAGTNNGVYISYDNGLNWNLSSNGLTNIDTKGIFINGPDILLSTLGGIYKSVDGGSSWIPSSVGIPGNSSAVTSFTKNGSSLFATHYLGVFKSDDNGFSWSLVNEGLPPQGTGGVNNVGNITSVNSTLFVTTNNGLYKSNDNATSWTSLINNLPSPPSNLYFSGASMYACVIPYGIYKSINSGNTWTLISTSFATKYLYANNKLYTTYLGINLDDINGIFKSENNDTDWSNIGLGRAANANDILKDGDNLYCATDNGFYFSNDEGNTWRLRNNGLGINPSVNCITKHGASLFIGTNKDGVFKTSDFGLNWVQVVNGLEDHYTIRSIESIGSELFIGAVQITSNSISGKLFKSSNDGGTWINSTNNGGFTNVYDIHAIGSVIFLATGNGVFLSTNSGASWIESNSGMPTNNIFALTSNGNFLFAAHADAQSSTEPPFGGVFVSPDYGSNWGNNNYYENNSVYSLFAINNLIFGGSRDILISDNNGDSWIWSGGFTSPVGGIHGDNNGVYAAIQNSYGANGVYGVFKYNGEVGTFDIPLIYSNIIYPNPFTSYLEVDNSFFGEGIKYEILDGSSRVVKNGEFLNNKIYNLDKLNSGLYYLKIIDKKKSSIYKVIKE